MTTVANSLPVGNTVADNPLQNALIQTIARKFRDAPGPDPGQYALRGCAVLSLDCTLTRLPDTTARDQVTLDQVRLLAAALQCAGVPTDCLLTVAETAVRVALSNAPIPSQEMLSALGAIQAGKASVPVQSRPKAGATSVRGTVGIVAFNQR